MAFMRNINDFILTLVALSLPSIAATIDCNGKPFHCLNSTHFMICVDFGSGVSSTMDDFVIPCPPTTVCQATNRFECEFPTVTTTTVASVVTNSPLAATVNNDVVTDTVSDVTTIPFEEYFNTISTTTLSEDNFITRDVVTTELPVNNVSKSEVNVAATDSNFNETAITVGVSANYFTTLATLDIATDEATVTEQIPNITENVNVIFEPNSNIGGTLLNKINIVPTDIDNTSLSENNTVDVTENYESNSTLLETIIGATNFRQFNTLLNNSTSYNVTEPILSEVTESIISKPIDDKQVHLKTLDASPDVVLDDKTIENVTESIPSNTTEYRYLIQSQSGSTLNENMSIVDIVQNNPNTLDGAPGANGFALNVNNSDLSFNEITTQYEEQISTAEPILFEAKENTTIIPVDDKLAYLPTLDAFDVFMDNQTLDNATDSKTSENKHLIQSQNDSTLNETMLTVDIVQNNRTTLDTNGVALNVTNSNLSFNEITTKYEEQISTAEPILFEAKENTTIIPVDDKQTFLPTLDASDVFLDNQTLDNATDSIAAETPEHKRLIKSQSNQFNNKPLYDSTPYDVTEPIFSEATQSIISKPIDDKKVYTKTLDVSPDVVLDYKTTENVTESIPEYHDLIQFQSNSTFNETMSTDDSVRNDPTTLDSTLDTNGFALNVNNSDVFFNEMTTKYEEQISTAEKVLFEAKENTTNIPVDVFLDKQTRDNATESIPAATTQYKHLIQAQSNQFNNKKNYNSNSYNATEPILSEVTESIISIPTDDKHVYLTTLDASPGVVLDDKTIENVTESIPSNTTEYKDLIQSQSDSTLNETMSTVDIVQNNPNTLDGAPGANGFALNVNNSDLPFNEITTQYEEQISTAEPILFEAKENTTIIPVDDKQAYLPTLIAFDVFLDNQTLDNATDSIAAETPEYKHLIQSQSNQFNNKPLYDSTPYDVTEPIFFEATESIINIPTDEMQVYSTTLDVSPDVVLEDKNIESVIESIPTKITEYKDLLQFPSNSILNETMATDDIVRKDPTTLTPALNTNALNVNNSDLSFNEITTKYEQQISTAEPVLNETKENKLDDKQAYLKILDASADLFLSNKTIDTVTESIPTDNAEYILSIESQSNTTLNAFVSSGDIEQNYTTIINTVLNNNGSASNVDNYNLSLNENTTPSYKEQISTVQNNFKLSGNTSIEITQPGAEMANITKLKLSVLTMDITTVSTEPISTNTQNAAINTGDAGKVAVKLNVIQSGNKTNISTSELSFKISNEYMTSTEDSVTSTSDNTYVKTQNNINTTQNENLTSVYYVENATKTETETEQINNMVSPKPPSSNETTTIVEGSPVDNTNTTYRIPDIGTIIAQNKTILHDNSARTDEIQRVITSEVNVNDMTAEATKNNNLWEPVTGPTSTPFSNIAHNVTGSDLTNESLQEMTTFINRIELNAKDNVTNETLTQNVISSDMSNSTKITVASFNQIGLNNKISVLTATDQINMVEISESTPNAILKTATKEVDSFTDNNVYYETDIEEISHDQGTPRNNLLSADTLESTPSILVKTTESTKEPHLNPVLRATASFNSVSDKTYTTERENYLTSTINSPTTAFDSIKSADDTPKPVENEVEKISPESVKLDITSALNENSYVATDQNIRTTDIPNSSQQTAITSSAAFVNTNIVVNQVSRQIIDKNISTEPSILQISFAINDTAYVATEQNIPSAELTPEPGDLIPDRFTYTTIPEITHDSVHKKSRITIASHFSTTEPSKSSALSAQNIPDIKETLIATTTSNFTAIPKLTVPNLTSAGVTNFGEEINGSTIVDSPTSKTTVDARSEASTSNVMEKHPITIKIENINPENTRNSIKTNTTTEEITVKGDTKHTELLRSYSIQSENINKLENTSAVTDQTTLASFIADDVNYNENQNKLADTQDRLLSNAQAEPNMPEPDHYGVNVYDPNSSVKNATFIGGLTSINTGVAADTKLTRDEINQQLNNKLVTPKLPTTETLLNKSLKGKDLLPVMPELKSNSGSIVKIETTNSKGDINAYPIITPKTSSLETYTEGKSSFTTSIQESKYQSNLASSTESWRATVVTEPFVTPTQPYTETLKTSSKPFTESNYQMSQDVTSLTPKLNFANPSEKQYINHPQNMEPVTKNIQTSSKPSVIFTQVTEPSGLANQDVQLSSILKSTTQKSFGIDTLNLVQNQRVSTEKHFINVRPPVSPSSITNPVDLSTRQPFTAVNTQILPEHGEQIEEPTTEKLTVTKVNVTPIISFSVMDNKPLVIVTAVPIMISSNNISKDVMLNAKTPLLTVMYNSNRTVESVSKTGFKAQLNHTTEKTETQSDLDIVMVDVIKSDSSNLGEIASGSNNTHSGISVIQKSTSKQTEKRKAIKSVTEYEHKTETEEEKSQTEKEEKPEVAESGKIEHLTSTEGIAIKKQANVQLNPSLNTQQKTVQNITNIIRPADSHVRNTTARYNTKSKSPVGNTHNSTLPAAKTAKQNFVCKLNNRGRFSDTGDCRKFYVCIGKQEPIKGICPNKTVFSELRKQCTKNLSHCVRNNQFQCVSEGRFSDYLYDNIYYICVNNKANRFIRFKLQCQNGYYLNKTSVRCALNTESILSTSQQSKSASEVSISNQSVSSNSEKIKVKPKRNKKFECKRSGKFPEPDDCRKYYVCTKLGKSEYRQKIKKCDSDEMYNRDKKKCVDADSYECS